MANEKIRSFSFTVLRFRYQKIVRSATTIFELKFVGPISSLKQRSGILTYTTVGTWIPDYTSISDHINNIMLILKLRFNMRNRELGCWD
jgi:hypothetical protein